MDDWLGALIGAAFSVILTLIGTVWWMLQKQIALRDRYWEARIADIKASLHEHAENTDTEIKLLRDRFHRSANRIAGMETVIRHGFFQQDYSDFGGDDTP